MTTADTLKLELLHRLDAFKAKMQGKQQPSKRERLNISPKERAALEKLSQTIKVDLECKLFPEPEEDKQVPVKDDRRGAADAEHGEEIKTEG